MGCLLCITATPAGIHKLRQPSRQPAPPVWPSFASLRHLQAHVRVQMSGSPAAAVPTCVAVMLRLAAPLFIPPDEVVHAEAAHERRRHDCSSSAGTVNLREVAAIRSHSCCCHHACFSTGSECEGYYKRVEPSLPKSSHCTSTITAAAQAEFSMQRHRQQGWWQALWFDAQAATAAAISAATKAGEIHDNRKWMQDASCSDIATTASAAELLHDVVAGLCAGAQGPLQPSPFTGRSIQQRTAHCGTEATQQTPQGSGELLHSFQ